MKRICLEQEAETVCIETAKPPLIFQLPPKKGRILLDEVQDSPVSICPGKTTCYDFDTKQWDRIKVYVIYPQQLTQVKHVTFYIHGAGWVFGNLHTHRKLVHELGARTNSIIVFPEYSLSPEAKYPTALEQCYAVLCALPGLFASDPSVTLDTLTVAGDSVGGNMATVMTLLSKFRNGPRIQKQLLFYPVTDANFNTPSYLQFAQGYYLYRAGMMWFWDQYTCSLQERLKITAAPLRATLQQLQGLPPAMIITGQADVLRDEGEAYACKLRKAGVAVTSVRYQAIIHDFVMLNALDHTQACRSAMDAAVAWILRHHDKEPCHLC